VALRGLVKPHASFMALAAKVGMSARLTPSSPKLLGMPMTELTRNQKNPSLFSL